MVSDGPAFDDTEIETLKRFAQYAFDYSPYHAGEIGRTLKKFSNAAFQANEFQAENIGRALRDHWAELQNIPSYDTHIKTLQLLDSSVAKIKGEIAEAKREGPVDLDEFNRRLNAVEKQLMELHKDWGKF